ncbi:osteopetrosis-associated transmembrane protein 1 [Silurus meridionalis]|nr:osteopetrosis-associated transmembrane protein 1 [Silurus meridionalis]
MLDQISIRASDASGDEERTASDFQENIFFPSLSLSMSEEQEITKYCLDLMHEYGRTYSSLASCLVSSARPVKVCQNCYGRNNSFQEVFANISTGMGPGNMSCEEVLFRSDRLMLLINLYNYLEDVWTVSECLNCLSKDRGSVSNTTLYFLDLHNQSLSCFEKYKQGNYSKLCVDCRPSYKVLNDFYSKMSNNNSLCIDIEDAMNMTRHLWSTTYKCSLQREENVPVIAVSSFMLFLPLIFYLSNYLHSEQKKRKLMHPRRVKSSHSLKNSQEKYS